MEQERKQEWEKTRVKGRLRYVLYRGVLKFGLPILIGTSLIEFWASDGKIESGEWFFRSALCLLGGALVGLFEWMDNEKKYLSSQ